MRRVLTSMIVSLMVLTVPAYGRVLLLSHFDKSLNADHSLYGQPTAEARGLALSPAGQGYVFKGLAPGAALDAGYQRRADGKAALLYPAENLESRRGTIEMWVKTAWAPDAPQSHKNDTFRKFLSVPLGKDGELSLYYAFYRWNYYTPFIVFHINFGGKDHIVNVQLSPSEQGTGLVWKKDTWHHLAATWTPTLMRLFVDGKLVTETPWDPPMDLPPVSGPISVGNSFRGGLPAGALIDDLRISDNPQYETVKVFSLPTAPLSATEDAAVVGAGGFSVTYQPDVRQYYCYKVDTPPVIDGKLDDAIWQRVPAMSGFMVYTKTNEYSSPQTEFRVCRDDKNIYLAVKLWESEMNKLKADAQPTPDGGDSQEAFGDDDAEIFFGRKQGKLPNVQIAVNANNAHCDIFQAEASADLKWNGHYRTATSRQKDGWIVEMAFPYSDLGPAPKLGDIWGMRVCRNRHVGGMFLSACNFGMLGFQRPDHFVRMIMAGALPTLDVTREETLLNQDYIAAFQGELDKFIREARAQITNTAEIPATVRDRAGISKLARDLQTSMSQAEALVRSKGSQPIAVWNARQMRMRDDQTALERLGYLVANADSDVTLPPASFKGIESIKGTWFLASDRIAAAVEPKHGQIAGIWDRSTGRRMVGSGYFLYQAQTAKTDTNADERTDRVLASRVEKSRLILDCVNPSLAGIKLKKEYYLEVVQGEPRLLCRRIEVTGKPAEPTLLLVTSRTLFDEAFRKFSFYNRIFAIGTMGDCRSYVPASEVTGRVLQRAWYNAEEGRAQFALENPATRSGLGEYLYKENDAWAFPQALPSSYWTPFGWDMGFAQTFVEAKPYSAELRYHVFHGDRLTFHREYLNLPEYAADRAKYAPSPKVAKVAGQTSVTVSQVMGDNPTMSHYRDIYAGKAIQALFRPDELMVSAFAMTDRRWPDFVVGDDQKAIEPHFNRLGVNNSETSCLQIRQTIEQLRAMNPRLLSQTYDSIYDVFKGSQTFKEHPEFTRFGRDGQPVLGLYGQAYVGANFSPEYVRYLVAKILRSMDYYKLDICYLDFGVGSIFADWGRHHVASLQEQMSLIRQLWPELHKRGQLLWLNSFTGQPCFDMGFFEGLGTTKWGSSWRDWAECCMMTKFYLPPGAIMIPLYWHAGPEYRERGVANEVLYIDKVVGSGLFPTACYMDPYNKNFPGPNGETHQPSVIKYQIAVDHAAFELRSSDWAEVGLKSAWWNDQTSTLEAYTLQVPHPVRAGASTEGVAFLVNVISHETAAKDVPITVDLKAMKFDPNRRTFIWQFLRRDYDKYPMGNPPPANWQQLFSSRTCQSVVPGKAEVTYTIPQLPPERLCGTAVSQTPAAIVSAAKIGTQFLLPSTLDCRVTGRADEKGRTVALRVSADKDVELIAWWPAAWGKASVVVDGKGIASAPVQFGQETFVRFAVEKGEHGIAVATE